MLKFCRIHEYFIERLLANRAVVEDELQQGVFILQTISLQHGAQLTSLVTSIHSTVERNVQSRACQ
jgi:hypothetical protein